MFQIHQNFRITDSLGSCYFLIVLKLCFKFVEFLFSYVKCDKMFYIKIPFTRIRSTLLLYLGVNIFTRLSGSLFLYLLFLPVLAMFNFIEKSMFVRIFCLQDNHILIDYYFYLWFSLLAHI